MITGLPMLLHLIRMIVVVRYLSRIHVIVQMDVQHEVDDVLIHSDVFRADDSAEMEWYK